jgi:hypothetical protein
MVQKKSNEQLLNEKLEKYNLKISHAFPGTSLKISREDICGEMLKAVDQVIEQMIIGVPEDA